MKKKIEQYEELPLQLQEDQDDSTESSSLSSLASSPETPEAFQQLPDTQSQAVIPNFDDLKDEHSSNSGDDKPLSQLRPMSSYATDVEGKRADNIDLNSTAVESDWEDKALSGEDLAKVQFFRRGPPSNRRVIFRRGASPSNGRVKIRRGLPSNGRVKGRRLMQWTRPRMMEKVLAILRFECKKKGIEVPWDLVMRRLCPGATAQSLLQYLDKLRPQMLKEGHLVPPPLSSARTPGLENIRGYIEERFGTEKTLIRAVGWDEQIEDRKFNRVDEDVIRESGQYRSIQAMMAHGDIPEVPIPSKRSGKKGNRINLTTRGPSRRGDSRFLGPAGDTSSDEEYPMFAPPGMVTLPIRREILAQFPAGESRPSFHRPATPWPRTPQGTRVTDTDTFVSQSEDTLVHTPAPQFWDGEFESRPYPPVSHVLYPQTHFQVYPQLNMTTSQAMNTYVGMYNQGIDMGDVHSWVNGLPNMNDFQVPAAREVPSDDTWFGQPRVQAPRPVRPTQILSMRDEEIADRGTPSLNQTHTMAALPNPPPPNPPSHPSGPQVIHGHAHQDPESSSYWLGLPLRNTTFARWEDFIHGTTYMPGPEYFSSETSSQSSMPPSPDFGDFILYDDSDDEEIS